MAIALLIMSKDLFIMSSTPFTGLIYYVYPCLGLRFYVHSFQIRSSTYEWGFSQDAKINIFCWL